MCDPKPLMDESAIKVMALVVIFRCYFCSAMLFIFDAVKQTNSRASLFFWFCFCTEKMWKGKNQQTLAKNPKHRLHTQRERKNRTDFFLFQRYECNNKRQSSIWFVCVCVSVCTQMIHCDLISNPFSPKRQTTKTTETNKQWMKEEKKQKIMMDIFLSEREFFL